MDFRPSEIISGAILSRFILKVRGDGWGKTKTKVKQRRLFCWGFRHTVFIPIIAPQKINLAPAGSAQVLGAAQAAINQAQNSKYHFILFKALVRRFYQFIIVLAKPVLNT